MTVLITGAGGFLGSHLVDLFLDRGESVRALVRSKAGATVLAEKGAEVCLGSLTDRSTIEASVRGVDLVVHSAARTGPWGPESEYEAVNVTATRDLFVEAMKAGASRIVHVSSATVHGLDVGGDADEFSPFHAEANPYVRTKIRGEQVVWRLIGEANAPIVVVRPGLIYGSRDDGSFGRFARMIQNGKMIVIGSGRNRLPLVHVHDVAVGTYLASQSDRAIGQAYILVNDEPVSQREYLNAIADQLGVDRPARSILYRLGLLAGFGAETVFRLAKRQASPPLTRFGIKLLGGENRYSIQKARRELGYAPAVGLLEGVRESVAWLKGVEREDPSARQNSHPERIASR